MNGPTTPIDVCAVYEEPRHRFHLRNAWTNVYEIELPRDEETLFHRHTEDTVYFVIADAEVRESFPDKAAVVTTATAGGTLCRAHHREHLVHQVRNIGTGTMHMLGAEALAQPPISAAQTAIPTGHTLTWESDRFRVFDVARSPSSLVEYSCFGLLVTFSECVIERPASETNGSLVAGLGPGGFLWVEPNQTLVLPQAFHGIFAAWV